MDETTSIKSITKPATFFVSRESVLRKIWGTGDVVLLIFAGASAEFALNRSVDWLFYTGKLPADPVGRLFSTVSYAREIIFSEEDQALKAIQKINGIHKSVEISRKRNIPTEAYRDVLYMLIAYSITAYETVERKLTSSEKQEVYDVFRKMGTHMGLGTFPPNYTSWKIDRLVKLQENLEKSEYTVKLFKSYRKQLGAFRYFLLLEAQRMLIPYELREIIPLPKRWYTPVLLSFYRVLRKTGIHKVLILGLTSADHRNAIKSILFRNHP